MDPALALTPLLAEDRDKRASMCGMRNARWTIASVLHADELDTTFKRSPDVVGTARRKPSSREVYVLP